MTVRASRCSGMALAAVLLCSAAPVRAADDAERARLDDFDRFCSFVANDYAYFDLKRTDWPAVCAAFRPAAGRAIDRRAFISVVETALDQLYDPHAHLGASTSASHRLIPTDSDVHAVWRHGHAVVVAIRDGSDAAAAGLQVGDEVLAIDQMAVIDATAKWMPRYLSAPDPTASDWALDVALAGRQDHRPVSIDVVGSRDRRTVNYLPERKPTAERVTAKCVGDVGVIQVNNSLGDAATIEAFDEALDRATCRSAVVLDLRDTPSGGNSTVARGIIGRFVNEEVSFQRHERPSEFRESRIRHVWMERVVPRPPYFPGRVVVLVGHWTGSMGEGLAIGLNATSGATVMGIRMAGLLGAIDTETLPHADLQVRIPTERLSHVDGTPRESFVPCPVAAGIDPLAAAITLARTVADGSCR